jgi:hypothetical protein
MASLTSSSPTSSLVDSFFPILPSSLEKNNYLRCEPVKEVIPSPNQNGLISQIYYQVKGCIQESPDIKHSQWKVELYEERIENIRQLFIAQQTFFKQLSVPSPSTNLGKWEGGRDYLCPLFKLYNENVLPLKNEEERFSLARLNDLRKLCKSFFENIRLATKWAQDYPKDSQSEQIHLLCYNFYTSINLNKRCSKILKVFKKAGEEVSESSNDSLPSKHILPLDSRYNLIRNLLQIHHYIEIAPSQLKSPVLKCIGNSVVGYVNGIPMGRPFNPNSQSNPVHLLFEKHFTSRGSTTNRMVKAIAMGSPTIENGFGTAHINAEFLGYLRHCAKNEVIHLYINHQDLIPRRWVEGDESSRCQALHDLSEQEEFKGTFYVATLSQNSWFYEHADEIMPSLSTQEAKNQLIAQFNQVVSANHSHILSGDLLNKPEMQLWIKITLNQLHQKHQSDDFVNQDDYYTFMQSFYQELRAYLKTLGQSMGYCIYNPSVEDFKKTFVDQLFNDPCARTGQKLPQELVEKYRLREWFRGMIDQIHQIIFEGRSVLTLEERRVFIRLAYRNLVQKFLIVTQADHYNISCKDRIDRGAATDAEDFAYLALLNNEEENPEFIDFFNTLVFSRAIIVRKRSIIDKRLKRLFETVRFMINHKEKLQKLDAQLFPEFSVSIQLLTKNELQN